MNGSFVHTCAIGVVDYSGFELRYLDQQRTFDSGVLEIGHAVVPSMIVPPGSSSFSIFGTCSDSCTSQVSVWAWCTTPVCVCVVHYFSEYMR